MKKFIIGLMGALMLLGQTTFAQNDSTMLYTVMYNHAPQGFDYPLIGFVNNATGNHKGAQIGFVNNNSKDFTGAQVGFVNTIQGAQNGAQVGFVNTTGGPVNGLQVAFINTAADKVNGPQIGFVNTQVEASTGLQVGFINTSVKKLQGAQIGFVNLNPKEVTGAQIGFVNTMGKLSTLQLGFVNYADSLKSGGVPIGFLSIVRKGGYQAVEVSYNELFPYNVSVKIGIPAFYTSVIGSYNPDFADEFAVGAGFGSIISAGPVFFVNPEASFQHQINANNNITRFNLNFGVNITNRFQLIAGPSATWIRLDDRYDYLEPNFSIYEEFFDADDQFIVGINAALRIKLSN